MLFFSDKDLHVTRQCKDLTNSIAFLEDDLIINTLTCQKLCLIDILLCKLMQKKTSPKQTPKTLIDNKGQLFKSLCFLSGGHVRCYNDNR